MGWTVIQTQANSERRAALNLERQGFEFYYPRFLATRTNRQRVYTEIRPLFPRYMFVVIVDRWRVLLSTIGVSRVLQDENGPVSLPASIIAELRARENKAGLVELPVDPISRFSRGQSVMFEAGALAGKIGAFSRMASDQRCEVLLELLGRKVCITASEDQLIAA